MKSTEKEIKNCVIWTRVSTKYQEDNGGSLQYQKDCCMDYAKSNGLNVLTCFESCINDKGSQSINDMLLFIQNDKSIKYVIVADINRLSRKVNESCTVLKELIENGVTVIETSSGLKTSDHNQLFMLQVKICMAEWDSEMKKKKLSIANKRNKSINIKNYE